MTRFKFYGLPPRHMKHTNGSVNPLLSIEDVLKGYVQKLREEADLEQSRRAFEDQLATAAQDAVALRHRDH